MVTITRHVFINIFQMGPFSAVKFGIDYEKTRNFLIVPNSPKVWKKSWGKQSDWTPSIQISFQI